jgi:outer membrane protein OmpA-like peptidoglycan-associated protein
MKHVFISALSALFLIVFNSTLYSQFDPLEKIKDKVEEKAEEKTDEAIDEGLNEFEKGMTEEDAENSEEQIEEQNEEQNDQQTIEGETNTNNTVKQKQDDLKSFSKFDFVPGENVVFFEDFSQDAIGDFPAKWNTNASGEVITLNNYPGNWFAPGGNGTFVPDFLNKLPENFTMEFDLIFNAPDINPPGFDIYFISSIPEDGIDALVPGNGGVSLVFGAYSVGIFGWKDGDYSDISNDKDTDVLWNNNKQKVRVSIAFQKQRARLWINETKLFDLPRVVPAGLMLDKIRFNTSESESPYFYFSNVRIAVGAPDMRSKLMTEGKLVTRGILFDVNSDKIKSESYGTLKEIAKVLTENSSVKVKIVGHTDSDGSDVSNLDLSKRRSAAVKNTLTNDFGISADRMETDGKGETEPSDKNTTSEAKANNRRVEFIKQ